MSARRLLLYAALAGPVLQWPPSCTSGTQKLRRHFDAPTAVAFGPSGNPSSPHVYAFVSDANEFAIRRIDVETRHLVEPRFPVGHRLGPLAAHVGSSGVVDRLWGVDREQGTLVGVDPASALSPVAGTATFSGAPQTVEMVDLAVKSGTTGTEDWTVTWREGFGRWEVVGSGSGEQNLWAKTGQRYHSDLEQVYFTIRSIGPNPPADGDAFTFHTDNGTTAAAAVATSSGAVNVVAFDADTGLVTTSNPPQITAFSLDTGVALQSWGLPAGAMPAGMEVSPDKSAVYIADLGNPEMARLITNGPVGLWALESLPVPVPLRDVAVSGDGERVFGMAADADDVFLWSAPGFTPLDFIGTLPGVDPVSFPAGIRAIAGARQAHVMRGSQVPTFPVFVTSHAGNLFTLNGSTGCLDFADTNGAHLSGARFVDSIPTSGEVFNAKVFKTSPCGGVTRSETWTFVYQGEKGTWSVTGSRSGKQLHDLVENVPYVTDRGEVTMEIDNTSTSPSSDGDQMIISVVDGIAPVALGNLPDRPYVVSVPHGTETREYAFVPNVDGDTVVQVDLADRHILASYR